MQMENEEYQIEKGNFTRLSNSIIEEIVKIPFRGCELAVFMYIVRKTYGFQKKEDKISLSQFLGDLPYSKKTIIKAIKNLETFSIINIKKGGYANKETNNFSVNKNPKKWLPFDPQKLSVTRQGLWGRSETAKDPSTSVAAYTRGGGAAYTSKTEGGSVAAYTEGSVAAYTGISGAAYTNKRKKENIKEINNLQPGVADEANLILKIFYEKVNPTINFGNITQRKAAQDLIKKFGFDSAKQITEFACSVQGQRFAPVITTPYQLITKLAQLKIYMSREQDRQNNFINLDDL